MKTIYLITLILISGRAICGDINNKFKLHSKNGLILMTCDDFKECQIKVNDQLIEGSFYINGDTEQSIQKLENRNSDVYLISVYNGDGCPIMYFIIEIKSDKSYIKTQTFGNCNEINLITNKDDSIQLVFPADSQASRTKYSYTYSLQKHVLTRKR